MNKKKVLYDALLKSKFTTIETLGKFEDFSLMLDNPENRVLLYNTMIESKKFTPEVLGTYKEFEDTLTEKKETDVPKSSNIRTSAGYENFGLSTLEERKANRFKISADTKQVINNPVIATKEISKSGTKAVANTGMSFLEGGLRYAAYSAVARNGIVDPSAQIGIDDAIYNFSNERQEYLEKLLPVAKGWENNFITNDLPQAVGSTIVFAGVGMLTGGLGMSPAIGASLTGAVSESQSLGAEVYGATKDTYKTQAASLLGIPIGATEGIPIGKMYEIIGGKLLKKAGGELIFKEAKEGLANLAKKGIKKEVTDVIEKKVVKKGIEELTQEAITKTLKTEGKEATEKVIKTEAKNIAKEMFGNRTIPWSLGKVLRESAYEGLEEFTQEFTQSIAEDVTAKELYDYTREIGGTAFRGGAAGFISGFGLSLLGGGIRLKRQKTIDKQDNEYLDKTEKIIASAIEKNVKEINYNAQFTNALFDKNAITKEQGIANIEDVYNLNGGQIVRLNNALMKSDGVEELREELYKTVPEMLENPTFLEETIYKAIQNPKEFEELYKMKVPEKLVVSSLKNISDFIRKENLMKEERTETTKSEINTPDISTKKDVSRETLSVNKRISIAKDVLTGNISNEKVLEEAKKTLGKDFITGYKEFEALPNNQDRINRATDKVLERGMILTDFSRRTIAAKLLKVDDINSDLIGMTNQQLLDLHENPLTIEEAEAIEMTELENNEFDEVWMQTNSIQEPKEVQFKNEFAKEMQTFLGQYGIKFNEAEADIHFFDLARKIVDVNINDESVIAPTSAKFLSNMLSYSDEFYDLMASLKGNKVFENELSKFPDRTFNSKRQAAKIIFEDLLNKKFNQEYMKANGFTSELVQKIKDYLQRLINKIKGINFSEAEDIIDRINDKIKNKSDFIRTTVKPGYELVEFQKAVDSNKLGKEILSTVATNENITLTGSLAFSAQGTVYRPINNLLHDIDLVSKNDVETNDKLIKQYFPGAIKIYSFFENQEINTYLVPPKGYTISNIKRTIETGNKIKSYLVLDKNGEKVGEYELEYDYDPETKKRSNEREIKKGVEALFVDFFTKDKMEREVVKHTFKGTGNKNVTINLSGYDAPFRAKLAYSRFKDIYDYNRFIPNRDDEVWMQKEAYHGSLYRFNKFSNEKINTGEGTQFEGYGIYFADKIEVAEYYAKALGNNVYEWSSLATDIDDTEAPYHVRRTNPYLMEDGQWEYLPFMSAKELSVLINTPIENLENQGRKENIQSNLYKVKLWKNHQEDLINWNNQIDGLQIKKILLQAEKENQLLYNLLNNTTYDNKTGQEIYNIVNKFFGSPKLTSEFLNRAGFDGIKYLSMGGKQHPIAQGIIKGEFRDHEGSQIKKIDGQWWNLSADVELSNEEFEKLYGHYAKESYNYVVFNDNAIEIEEHAQFQQPTNKPRGVNSYGQIVDTVIQPTPAKSSKFQWARNSDNNYEVSSQGDKRFSALNAKLKDGRTIEEAYQLDVKGYRIQGDNWKLGKGKPPINGITKNEQWEQYKILWKQYLNENPNLENDLRNKAKNKVLTDKFANTEISQARALAEILNENKAPQATNVTESTETTTTDTKAQQRSSITARELLTKLEEQGYHDTSIEHFLKWAIKQVGDVKIRFLSSAHTFANGQQLGNNPGFYVRKNSTDQHYIGINQDFMTDNQSDLYRTVAHEVTHAVIQKGLKENRQFRTEVSSLMNDFRSTLQERGLYNESMNPAFENEGEFIAYAMSNTSEIRQLMQSTPIANSDKATFLGRLKSLIRTLFKNMLGLQPTYFQGLEVILNRSLGYELQNQYMFNDEITENDEEYDNLVGQMDKTMLITDTDKQDPRSIRTIAVLLGKQKGLNLRDYYDYIRKMDYNDFKNNLMENPDWKVRSKFHYDKHYSERFKTLEQYQKTLIRNMYNSAKTMVNIPYIRLIINKDFTDGKVNEKTSIKLSPEVFKDKKGNIKVAIHEHMKVLDLVPELNKLLENEFEPMILENIEVNNSGYGKFLGKKNYSIFSYGNKQPFVNTYMSKVLGVHGYVYLGNWADKDTVVVLKNKNAINPEIIKEIAENYHKNKMALVEKLWKNNVGEDVANQHLAKYGTIENALKETGHPLLSYINKEMSKSKIIRLLLEDLKLGGSITAEGKLVSALYNINNKDTYDALRIYKRGYLSSPTRYVHQDKAEVDEILESLNLKNHGMIMTDEGLKCRSLVVDVEKMNNDAEIEVDDKKYNLKQLLINNFGTARLDGPVFYVKGGLDVVWDELHGTTKTGVKKGWIGNSFTNPNFRSPLYVKGAFHMVSEKDVLGKWLTKNNITFLIANSAAKINSYPVVEMNADNIEGSVFTIPFSEVQRQMEKSEAKDNAKGLAQTITANWMTKANKSFVDKGWKKAIGDIIEYNMNTFIEEISDFNYAKIVEHYKDKALTDTSEQGKSVAGVINELLLRKVDKTYDDLKQTISLIPDRDQKKRLNELLRNMKDKVTVINEQLGNEFGNFFQEPFFAIGLRSYMSELIENIYNFRTPSTYLVLSPDLGVLSQSRLKAIEKNIKSGIYKDKLKLYEEMKPYIALKDKIVGIEKQIEYAKGMNPAKTEEGIAKQEKNKVELALERDKTVSELSEYDDKSDNYEFELENYFSNGKVTLSRQAGKEAIDKEKLKYVDENGYLRDGYVMISKDVANKFNVKVGDDVTTAMVPSSNGMSAGAHKVIAILGTDLVEPGTIIMNSEYIQTILGKDFDIDTTLFIPKSDAFTDEGWKGFVDTLRESYLKHRKDIKEFYQKQDSQITENSDILRKNPERSPYSSKSKLNFIMKHFKKSNFKEGTLFDPLSNGWDILEKFNKEIGIPINRRKINTFKSMIGLKTMIYDQIIDTNHDDAYQTYMLNDVLTHHKVDMPTDTGFLYYRYDDVKAFDQDNGTNYYGQIEEALKEFDYELEDAIRYEIYKIQHFEDFLFTYAIKLNTEYHLDERQNVREYTDTLKFISEQKDINGLLKNEDKRNELIKLYEKYIKADVMIKKDKIDGFVSIATQYLTNLSIENMNDSPMNEIITKFPFSSLPNITTSELDYSITQGNIINALLNNDPLMKKVYKIVSEHPISTALVNKLPLSGIKIAGLNIDSNHLMGRMFLLTAGNTSLHELKAKLVSLIFPIDQTTRGQLQIDEMNNKMNMYMDSIYQQVNSYSYPLLFEKLLRTGTYVFKREQKETKIGKAILHKVGEDQLKIYYDKKDWSVKELVSAETISAKEVVSYIKGQLATNPSARANLSDLLSLGGYNIPLSERQELAINLLNDELDKFSSEEQMLLWTSLLGKSDEKLKYPLNLVAPLKSSTSNFHSQKILLHILGQINSPSGNNFLNLYGKLFNENYHGKTIKEVQAVSRLVKDNIMDDDVEIFFQTPGVREILQTTEDPTLDRLDKFKDIFDLINSTKEKDIKANTTERVSTMVDLEKGEIEAIDLLDVVNATSRFQTRIKTDVNYEAVALTKAAKIMQNISKMEAKEDKGNNLVETMIKEYAREHTHLVKNPVKWLKVKREAKEKIANIIELNRMNITEISKNNKDQYLVIMDGKRLIDVEKMSRVELDHYGLDNTVVGHLFSKGLGKDVYLHRAAFEYIKRYSHDNIGILRNMKDYLLTNLAELSNDFGRLDIAESMIRKYDDLITRFSTFEFSYFPRIVRNNDIDKIIENIRKEKAIQEITKRVKEAHERKKDGKIPNKKYLVNDDAIPGLVEDYLTEVRSRIVKNQYGDYIFTFQMKRVNDELTNGLYVKDSLAPHEEHQKMFHRMLEADLSKLNFLDYEYQASKAGRTKKQIKLMQAWVAASIHRPEFLTYKTSFDKLKADDKIQFYFVREHIKGVFKKQDDKYIYLHFDNDMYHNEILEAIDSIGVTNKDISNVKEKEVTNKQYRLMIRLYNEGYLKNYENVHTNLEANQVIYDALMYKLNSPETWGRYKKSRVYTKDYVNGKIAHVNAVDKNFVQSTANWASLAKSINRGLFLGAFSGARANIIDAMHMLNQDFGLMGFIKYLPKGMYYNKEFLVRLRNNEINKYESDYKNLKDFIGGYRSSDKVFEKMQKEYAASIAAKWLTESGILRRSEFGKEMASSNVDWKKAKGILKVLGQGVSATSTLLTIPREAAEQRIRITAAYMYAYKAIVRDGLTDAKEIEGVIEHGIAGTQGMYQAMYKKLGEASQTGSLFMQFSHYNTYMLKKRVAEWKQMKSSKDKFDIKDFFSIDSSKMRSSIDPNIKNRYVMDFWYNMIGRTFELLMPGLRAGDPVFRLLNLAIYNLAMVASGNWDSDDDGYDLEDLFYSILSFWIGSGATIPMQAVWNLLSPKDTEETKVSDIIPVNNRVTNSAKGIYNIFVPEEDKFTPKKITNSYLVSSSAYRNARFEFNVMGMNTLYSVPRSFSSKEAQEFQNKNLFEKGASLIPFIGENSDALIPVYNMFKYHK